MRSGIKRLGVGAAVAKTAQYHPCAGENRNEAEPAHGPCVSLCVTRSAECAGVLREVPRDLSFRSVRGDCVHLDGVRLGAEPRDVSAARYTEAGADRRAVLSCLSVLAMPAKALEKTRRSYPMVKAPALAAVPAGVVTRQRPVQAPAGTVVVILVGETTVNAVTGA